MAINTRRFNHTQPIEKLESRWLLSSASSIVMESTLDVESSVTNSTVQGYTPAQIKSAYGFTAIKGDGSGQTIAIVDAYNDPNIASDLQKFDSTFGLSAASLKVVNQTGGSSLPATDAGWALEISLDVEWAHAIAPGAKILLVEAKSSSLTDLLAAVNYARKASGVSVVSMSWGTTEFSSETSYDSYFTTPSGHQGVTFVASSGDDAGYYGALWPSISSNVLSVGGTTLNLTSSGSYSSETAWSDSTGGISRYESEASYQQIAQRTGRETSPDVSYDANPSTGFAVYDSVTYEGQSGWFELGGTSAGAPQWAALIAIANQQRVAKGKGTLNGVTGTLSTLYSLYTSSTYSADYHDVTSGNNGVWLATSGYDAVTGLGSPKAAQIVAALVGASGSGSSSASVAVTANTARSAVVTGTQARTATTGSVNSEEGLSPASITDPSLASPVVFLEPISVAKSQAAASPTPPKLESVQIDSGDAPMLVGPSIGLAPRGTESVSQESTSTVDLANPIQGAALTNQQRAIGTALADPRAIPARLLTREDSLATCWAVLMGTAVIISTYNVRTRRRPRATVRESKSAPLSDLFGEVVIGPSIQNS